MHEIKEDVELLQFDGVTEVTVYSGCLNSLKQADVTWRVTVDEKMRQYIGDVKELKLSEIVQQLGGHGLITIVINGPLRGEIWQWGNYGDSWWCIGELSGYA